MYYLHSIYVFIAEEELRDCTKESKYGSTIEDDFKFH
jgi:hypothetical protein